MYIAPQLSIDFVRSRKQVMSVPSASDGQRSKLTVPLDFLTEIANADRIDKLCASIAQWMPQIFPADRISIALPTDKGLLRVAAVHGDGIPYDTAQIPIAGTKLGDSYLSRTPIVVNDADRLGEKYARRRTPGQDTYRSTAILPLVVGDTCLGNLNFGCVDANRFPLETVTDLGQIATWIALQLSRFETHEWLKTSEARFGAPIENAEAMIFAKAADGTMLITNRKFYEVSGLRPGEVVGKLDSELFGQEAAAQWQKDDLRVLESKTGESIE